MEIKHYDAHSAVPVESLLDLFEHVDADATGETYDTSTVDMSREMFFDSEDSVSDRKALERFYEEYGEEVVLARHSNNEKIIGFTFLNQNDSLFQKELPDYTPNLAITFSGVHPEHQREGVWSALRDYICEEIVPQRDVEYLVTGASVENTASQEANKGRGFVAVRDTDDVDGDEATVLLAKDVSERC